MLPCNWEVLLIETCYLSRRATNQDVLLLPYPSINKMIKSNGCMNGCIKGCWIRTKPWYFRKYVSSLCYCLTIYLCRSILTYLLVQIHPYFPFLPYCYWSKFLRILHSGRKMIYPGLGLADTTPIYLVYTTLGRVYLIGPSLLSVPSTNLVI